MRQACGRRTLLLVAIATVLSVGAFSARAKVDPTLTPDDARAIAQDAWVFGLPLVYLEKQIDAVSHVTRPQGPFAPINQFAHQREFPDAANRAVAGLNFDT